MNNVESDVSRKHSKRPYPGVIPSQKKAVVSYQPRFAELALEKGKFLTNIGQHGLKKDSILSIRRRLRFLRKTIRSRNIAVARLKEMAHHKTASCNSPL